MTKLRACSWILAATVALLQLGTAVSSRDIPEFPKNRFTPWNQLNWMVRSDARYLLFVPETWNRFLSGPLERMTYEEVADFLGLNDAQYMDQWQDANSALQNIAIDSRSWDCWINHYIGNDWEELRDTHNISWAFEALGWNSTTWKSSDPNDWPETENLRFAQLSEEQAMAAESICCPANIWDGVPLARWEYNSEGISTVQLEFEAKYSTPTLTAEVKTITQPPSATPTEDTSNSPTEDTSNSPTTSSPTTKPSGSPTDAPSRSPSTSPTSAPTSTPSFSPTTSPSFSPTMSPSYVPTMGPTATHTSTPTKTFSNAPTFSPSVSPTVSPTVSMSPTSRPSSSPSWSPSYPPSSAPSDGPSSFPTESIPDCIANFTLVVLTDKFPRETSWTLVDIATDTIVSENLGYMNDFEPHRDTMCVEHDSCYMFTIYDKWDDGICCENGQGSYSGYIEYPDSLIDPVPIPGLNGGAFESQAQHQFCIDRKGQLVEGDSSAIGVRFNGRNGGARR